MAKRHENEARDRSRNQGQYTRQRTEKDVYGEGAFGPGGLASDRYKATLRRDETFDKAKQGYDQMQQFGGYDPQVMDYLRGKLMGLGDYGGYDPEQLGKARESYDTLIGKGNTFSDTGGYDQDIYGQINKGYGNFAETGGFTPEQMGDFRRRATSGVGAVYNVLGNEAERRRTTTGGLGTGGEISQMARQLSQAQARAATDAEVELANQIRQGKLAGLGGLADVQSDVSGRRLAGLGLTGSLVGQRAGLEGDVAGARRDATRLQLGFEGDVAGGRRAGTAGMAGLYNVTTGEISDIGRQILAQYGLDDASQETQLRILQSLAGTPGILDNIQRIGGMVSGGLGALAGI